MPNAVILDAQSLGPDIDLTAIRDAVTHEIHRQSTTAQARERLADAEIAIVNKVSWMLRRFHSFLRYD